MTVVFKNIKINACYQYYNRGENGAVVHTKVDPSWGSVVSVGEIISTLQQSLTNLEDVLKNFSGVASDVEQLKTLNKQLEEIYLFIVKVEEYTDEGKDAIRKKIAEIKSENEKLISNPSICKTSSGTSNGRVMASSCPIDQAEVYIEEIRSMLGVGGVNDCSVPLTAFEKANLRCHSTARGNIYSWMLKMTDGDYKQNFAEGLIAHHIIQNKYRLLYGGSRVETEYAIPKSSVAGNQGYADIVNFTSNEIFEIKSTNGETQGAKEVELYVCRGNEICRPASGNWRKGTVFPSFKFIWPLDPSKEIDVRKSDYDGVISYVIREKSNLNVKPAPEYEPIPPATHQRIQDLIKRILKEKPTELEQERMIRVFLAGLSTAGIYALVTTGVVGDMLAVVQTYVSGGTLAPAAVLQASICTAFVVIGIEIINSR